MVDLLVLATDGAEDLQIRRSTGGSASELPGCAPCFALAAGRTRTQTDGSSRPPFRQSRASPRAGAPTDVTADAIHLVPPTAGQTSLSLFRALSREEGPPPRNARKSRPASPGLSPPIVLVAERRVCERGSPAGHGWPAEWARTDEVQQPPLRRDHTGGVTTFGVTPATPISGACSRPEAARSRGPHARRRERAARRSRIARRTRARRPACSGPR